MDCARRVGLDTFHPDGARTAQDSLYRRAHCGGDARRTAWRTPAFARRLL